MKTHPLTRASRVGKSPSKLLLSTATVVALVASTAGPACAETSVQTSWKLNSSLSPDTATTTEATVEPDNAPDSDNFVCPSLQIVVVNGEGDNNLTGATNTAANARLGGMVTAGIRAGNEGEDNQAVAATHISWQGANRDQLSLGSTNRPTLDGTESDVSTGGIGGVESKDLKTSREAEEISVQDTVETLFKIAQHCPKAKFFITGQSEGAGSAHRTLNRIANGEGPIDTDRVAGGALYSDPYRSQGQSIFGAPDQTRPSFPGGKNAKDYNSLLGEYTMPAPEGAGIKTFAEANTHLSAFGALADRIGSFCLPMDLICSMVQKSPIGEIFQNVKGSSTTFQQDPLMAVRDLSSSFLGTSIRTANDFVMNDIDFDWNKGAFVLNKDTDTVLGRAVGYSTQGRLGGGDLSPLVGSITKVGGMALGATVTAAKHMISPAALMGYAAAGISGTVAGSASGGTVGGAIGGVIGGALGGGPALLLGPLGTIIGGALGGAVGGTLGLGGAVGLKGATTAMAMVPPNTLAAGAQKLFKEVTSLGLSTNTLAEAATQSQMNIETQQSGYRTTPVTGNGMNPLNLGSQWIASLGKMLNGTSTKDALSTGGSLFSSLMKGGTITATLTGGTGSGTLIDAATGLAQNAAPMLGEAGSALSNVAGPLVESIIPAATSMAGELIPTAASILTGVL